MISPKLESQRYLNELDENVLPFWINNSLDQSKGGYFTCLDKTGQVYDTDKFVWLQARQVWTFSMLYNEWEKRDEFLSVAKLGMDFLDMYGADADGNFFFSLDRYGNPLIQPYNIFSDCFACMAYAQYGKASGNASYLEKAEKVFRNILSREQSPKGRYEKTTGNRPMKNFALPMILSNLALELEGVLPASEIDRTVERVVKIVMEEFRDQETGWIYENRSLKGEYMDTFEGRLLNPGHGIEAMWFMMDIAKRYNDSDLHSQAVSSLKSILAYSWDQHYGGLYYFMDDKGYPPQQLEHDQKLWWVHLETLVALSKALKESPNDSVLRAEYQKIREYSFQHFSDPENGEWFGYLNREGRAHVTLKGGKWKGCFHVPRALFQCYKSWKI